ncbi:MAG: aspartate aminotransferase family protein [Salinisphaeraceae bacterium]
MDKRMHRGVPLYRNRVSSLLHRSLSEGMPTVVGGSGAWLIDADGRRYLDACGGAAVSCLGHNDPRINEAIADQLGRVAYAHSSFFTNEPAERLARTLVDRAPPGFGDGAAMFLGSGSEAMEAALKLARQHALETGEAERSVVIARDMAYHGNTLGALAVGGHRGRRRPYEPLLIEVARVAACYPYRNLMPGEDEAAYATRLAAELDATIRRLGPERVLAFVLEPVSGATLGCVPPSPGYLKGVAETCARHGVLLIADEVMCGVGRTGSFYAVEQEGVAPDIITIAKGLGAGYVPIAATLASGRVIDALRQGSGTLANGHTYMSHAASCAGALAVLDAIDRADSLDAVRARGQSLRRRLEARFGDHPNVGEIRGRGLFQAIEFVADRKSKAPLPAEAGFAPALKRRAMARGLLVYPAQGCVDGSAGDHVVIAPPYTITEEELALLVDRLVQAFDETIAATAVIH